MDSINKIKVALVDTGIDINHEYLKNNIIGGISIYENEYGEIELSNDYNDDNGHGTRCASLIKKEFPDVQLFVIKVFDETGRSNLRVFEYAMKYILNLDVNIVNLSLSFFLHNNSKDKLENIHNICEKLKEQNKIIIASEVNSNGDELIGESYPSAWDSVIGVKGFILEDKKDFWYDKNKKVQCLIDNEPSFSCVNGNTYGLAYRSNSLSTAKLSGIVSKIMNNYNIKTFKEVEDILIKDAKRTEWSEENLIRSFRYPKEGNKNLKFYRGKDIKNVWRILEKILDIKINLVDLESKSLFNPQIGLEYEHCFEFVKELERQFKVSIDYMELTRNNFWDIYNVIEMIDKYR